LLPGHYLTVQLNPCKGTADVTERAYWEMDFPDQGDEEPGSSPERLIDQFEEVMMHAVERRLRADVPVVSYLSGGGGSSAGVALASYLRRQPIPTFTIQIKDPSLDETNEAAIVARHVGTRPVIVGCGPEEVLNTYRALIEAAEGPVIDTSCAALLLLA